MSTHTFVQTGQHPRPTGFAWWASRILAGLLAFTLALAISGATYQWIASTNDARTYPPPGQMINVGAYRLHLHCVGDGSPTVILEAGAGNSSLAWAQVQPAVAKLTRVCAYDRAGMGWSDSPTTPRTGAQVVQDLHTLLVNASVPGPYVLVAHSFPGVYTRLYASQYPDDVAGMVLVDSGFESLLVPFPKDLPLDALRLCRAVAPLGIVRIFGLMDSNPEVAKASPDSQTGIKAHLYQTRLCGTVLDEYANIEEAARDVLSAPTLGDKPLVILTAGDRPADDWPPDTVWQQAQADLLSLSSDSQQVIADESSHYINLDQPELVVDAIQRVLRSAHRQ